MTEKRFRTGKGILEEGYPSETIIDNKTGKTYYKSYANYKSAKEMCELLNKLSEENERLKQSNQKLNDELQETMGYLALKSNVEKENEQLKKIRDIAFELAEKPTQHTLWKFRNCLKEYNNRK